MFQIDSGLADLAHKKYKTAGDAYRAAASATVGGGLSGETHLEDGLLVFEFATFKIRELGTVKEPKPVVDAVIDPKDIFESGL